jgi:chromosome segregation ATPase
MLKNWVMLTSLSCGIGFGSTLLISRNLQQSTLTGLITIPAVVASITVLSRQRKEEIDRQTANLKIRLDILQQQENLIAKQLQFKELSYKEIDKQLKDLQSMLENSHNNVKLYRKKKKDLEQEISSLSFQKDQCQNLLLELQKEVQQSEVFVIELRDQANKKEASLNQSTTQHQVLLSEFQKKIQQKEGYLIKLRDQVIKEEVNLNQSTVKLSQIMEATESKAAQMEQLIMSVKNAYEEVKSYSIDKHNLESNIKVLQLQQNELLSETLKKQSYCSQLIENISQAGSKFQYLSEKVGDLDELLERKQYLLKELDLSINNRCEIKEKIDQEIIDIKISQSDQESKTKQNDDSSKRWPCDFEDDPYMGIFKHIEKHGVITESEATNLLGNSRKVRQFSNKLGEYCQYLPFVIKVETHNGGSRYVKHSNN